MKASKPIFMLNWRIVAAVFFSVGILPSFAAFILQQTSLFFPTFAPPAGGRGDSGVPIISADGRYVLFSSTANNFVLATNNVPIPVLVPASLNVYLRDRSNNTTVLISDNLVGNGGGNGDSLPIGISANGQYVLFESTASDLMASDTNNASDVFVHNLTSGTKLLVSVNTNGLSGNKTSHSSAMTPDGRYVAFVSAANNLVPGDTNNIPDIFVRDLFLNATTLASVGAISVNSSTFSGGSDSPAITPDGRYVAFLSSATNLIPGVLTKGEIYVRDMVANANAWATTNARPLAYSLLGSSNILSSNLAISADGQFVAFEVFINPPAASAPRGIILRQNLQTGATDIVHTNANVSSGTLENLCSLDMTSDGRFIAFVANASSSFPLTTSVYRWDAQTGTNSLVSAALASFSTNGVCDSPVISTDGRYVVFVSSGTNFTTNVLTGEFNLYVRDVQTSKTFLVNTDSTGKGSGLDPTSVASLSAVGQLISFASHQGNLVTNDSNLCDDVFVFNLAANTKELISVSNPSLPGNGPTISWPVVLGQTYQPQFKNSLSDSDWQNIIGNVVIIGPQGYTTDLAPVTNQRFYRVRVQ